MALEALKMASISDATLVNERRASGLPTLWGYGFQNRSNASDGSRAFLIELPNDCDCDCDSCACVEPSLSDRSTSVGALWLFLASYGAFPATLAFLAFCRFGA